MILFNKGRFDLEVGVGAEEVADEGLLELIGVFSLGIETFSNRLAGRGGGGGGRAAPVEAAAGTWLADGDLGNPGFRARDGTGGGPAFALDGEIGDCVEGDLSPKVLS